MAQPDILLIAPMTEAVRAEIGRDFVIHDYWKAENKQLLLDSLKDRLRFVATSGNHGCSAEIMQALPKLELIASFGVGYDAVDVAAAKERGVHVTNTPEVLNDCVAEMTLALMLAACHQIPQADRYVREGRWQQGNFPLTDELTGRTAGILGLGRIGKEIARRLQAFKMQVVYHGRNRQKHEPYPYYSDLETMAREVDWLVVVAPATSATKGIVDRRILDALGPEGCLVNIARGTLVDEAALLDALKERRIKGAALDVFANEPNVAEEFLTLPNVVLSPHQGSATHKTRGAMGEMVVANLRAHLRGDPLLSPVV